MKKFSFIITLILFCGNYLFAQTWDILDKSMSDLGTDWAIAQGSSAGGAVTQQTGYVNFKKTNTGASGNWSWLRPATALADLTNGQAYSIEVKARVNPIGINDDGSNIEANQISLRLKSKASTPIYLRYGDAESGSISTTSSLSTSYKINTSEWQIYRIVLRADLKYDVYIDGIEGPIFEGLQGGTNNDQNGIYFGAESRHRCNMDIEYVKMGTGDFFSKPRISSVILSRDNHIAGKESTVSVTANTVAFNNGEKLLFSLVDQKSSNVIVDPIEGTVNSNIAAANIVIPANAAIGQYAVKVAANGQVSGMDITPKTVPYEIIDPATVETWDIINRDFSVRAWDASPMWSLEKGGNVSANFVTQKAGYVNINKTQAYGSGYYGFLISPEVTLVANTAYTYEIKARVQAIDKNEFPDTMKPLPSGAGGYESNQIAFRLNNKYMSIHLMHGDENTGYIAPHVIDGTGICPSSTVRHALNTSEWHVYRMIFNADNTKYDIYVDGELIFKDIIVINKSGTNIAKIGGESWQRCNMDIEYIKMATGDLVIGDKPRIKSVDLSSDSHVANNERTIQVTANTLFVSNGEKFMASLTDTNGNDLVAPVEITVNTNKGSASLTIPSTIPLGKYAVKVVAATGKIGDETIEPKTMQYAVVGMSPLDTKMLPQVKPVGYVTELTDYKYIGNGEFIFPSIVDTKKYTVEGKFKNGQAPIDRYYLYYAPHDNPGGIYLSTAPTLDGPWTQYDGTAGMSAGTVMDFDWAARQSEIVRNGAERHISACQVVWNEIQDKYIMYFHGPNTTTHYATSDDLINWTFGESVVVANQFSVIGAEASYAKVFEHEIAGLGNKYVMLLMNQESQIRRIYWAHSTDGIKWTPVTKPLISPDLNYKKIPGTNIKPNYDGGGTGAYGNNVSGPFLMEKDGRYFVFVHGCTDHLLVVEVGKDFDMEVHWGEYLKSTDAMFTQGGSTTATRIAAPDFIQDDNGKWYMFFEAGGRLGANIGYAKEPEAGVGLEQKTINTEFISISNSLLNAGQELSVKCHVNESSLSEVMVYSITGNEVSRIFVSGDECTLQAPNTCGAYVMMVKLNDNTAQTFKILVR